ncbi:YceI family protein [Ruegeria sp. R14_0]|uniref:YceI family protein n=1 Tax=Ruegeria sp. R14_0 TaxID=2821100 RepID=UPI001ADAD4C4|nr:YceI family protein [Ruegeria sp. R14_0]MBO9447417.1 polyisoprenoid-binding protein [Ruegeria sp. R14_0]
MTFARARSVSGILGTTTRKIVTSAAFSASTVAAYADMARYELDPTHTAIYFTIDHIGYAKTLGVFTDVTGSFMYDTETQELRDVEVTIQAASVNTFNDARDGHVRNQDFLDVSTYPEITFVANGGTPSSANSGTVTGELTVLDQTLPVTLNVTLNKAAEYPFGHKREVLGLSLDTSILRSEFGMDYGVANGLVGDEVSINIETEAIKEDG